MNLSSTFQSEKNFYYSLEKGMTVVYWDLSNVFEKFKDIAIVPNTDSAIRSISLSQQHDTHYLTLILRNTSLVTLNITLQGKEREGLRLFAESLVLMTCFDLTNFFLFWPSLPYKTRFQQNNLINNLI